MDSLVAVDCIFAWLIACRHETFETTVVIGVLEAPDSLVRSLGLTYTQLLAFLSWPLRPPLPTPPPPNYPLLQCDSYILSRVLLMNSDLGRLEVWSCDQHVKNSRPCPQSSIGPLGSLLQGRLASKAC